MQTLKIKIRFMRYFQYFVNKGLFKGILWSKQTECVTFFLKSIHKLDKKHIVK